MTGLDICDFEEYKAEIKTAGRNGSIDSLTDQIMSLTLSGNLVQLRHHKAGHFSVSWLDKNGEAYMVGVLVYHDSDNTWFTHT